MMKVVANVIGILSIPIYWFGLTWLFSGLFLAFDRLSAFFGLKPWFLGPVALFFVIPVSITLGLWLGHLTQRLLLDRWSPSANALG